MCKRLGDSIAYFVALAAAGLVSASVAQQEAGLLNYVVASDRLHTSGQPDSEQLLALPDRGFDLVINLATPTSPNSIPDEGRLVAQGGAYYVNIPVDWRAPTYEDFEFFSGILNQSSHDRVLVHCMLNYRASLFTFLYRTVHQGVAPEEAYEAVAAVW
ncbi:MAG: protein tyrosine phosphatase family protein [Rhodospirillaceae bacterium]|nr:protein tyrosine phosphatase family protein [Rhodospirillaceae bacterium]